MVARSPRKQHRSAVAPPLPPLSPTLLRDTVKKVEKCMSRLQELQQTVADGRKTKADFSTKQELLWSKNGDPRRSPPGKLPASAEGWRRMSLPAMLLGEKMEEIMEASQLTRNIVNTVSSSNTRSINRPKTPPSQRKLQKQTPEHHSELVARRRTEKQAALQAIRSESDIQNRAKSRITFKKSSPEKKDHDKENCRYIANRISLRNRPWARKTVLFPNPLFQSSPTSPSRYTREIPHKFLIKSPTRPTRSCSNAAAKLRRSFSPSRLANRLASSPMKNIRYVEKNEGAGKPRRSFSPARVVSRMVSPLKSRKCVMKNGETNVVRGLKQRPTPTSETVVEGRGSCLPSYRLRASSHCA